MKGTFVYINMPTKNVAAAREFYTTLGFDINKEYSSDENVFVVLTDNTHLILADEAFLRQLGEHREFADTTKTTEASLAVSVGSRQEVDELFGKAISAGGKPAGDTIEEAEIGLYARLFTDLDGHKISINHMSTEA